MLKIKQPKAKLVLLLGNWSDKKPPGLQLLSKKICSTDPGNFVFGIGKHFSFPAII